jgi:hypothetical protein
VIRRASRYLDQRPLLAVLLGFVVAFVLLCVASDWDKSDTAALRLQMMSMNYRSAT